MSLGRNYWNLLLMSDGPPPVRFLNMFMLSAFDVLGLNGKSEWKEHNLTNDRIMQFSFQNSTNFIKWRNISTL